MYCTNYGTKINSKNDKFCTNCGNQILIDYVDQPPVDLGNKFFISWEHLIHLLG